jgi:hypothetical protein
MGIVKSILRQGGGKSSSTSSVIAFNTNVGSIAAGNWLVCYTVSSMQSISIDFGDGTVIPIDITTSTTSIGQSHTYGEGFGVGVTKTIRIIIPDRTNVKYLSIAGSPNGPIASVSPVPVEISRLENLETLILGAHNFTGIPASILDLETLTAITVNGAFGGDLTLYDSFPDNLLYQSDGVTPRPLVTLGHSIRSHSNGSGKGYDRLADLAGTLKTLSIIASNSNVTDFPSDLASIPLEHLLFNISGALTQMPTILNSITSLKSLYIGTTSGITNMANLPALVNLETLDLGQNGFNVTNKTNVDICDDWATYTKLKTVNLLRNFTTTARADDFVDNFYDFVVSNAPITGTSADAFRSMAINFSLNGTLTGTYQEPSGYSAGSSNGSPASPAEKRWVLVNQYAHTWTM